MLCLPTLTVLETEQQQPTTFSSLSGISHVSVCACCHLSVHWAPLGKSQTCSPSLLPVRDLYPLIRCLSQPQSSSAGLQGRGSHSLPLSVRCCKPSLAFMPWLQCVHVCLGPGSPGLDPLLCACLGSAEERRRVASLDLGGVPSAAGDAAEVRCWLAFTQDPEVLLCKASCTDVWSRSSPGEDFVFPFAGLPDVVKVLLNLTAQPSGV